MIYSKAGDFHHLNFSKRKFKNLCDWKPASDDVFYHHFYNEQQRGIRFSECVDEKHWDHIRKTPTTKVLHENCGETFNFLFVLDVIRLVELHKINPNQIYIVVMDELHREFLESNLIKYGITGINFASFNYLLSHIQPVEGDVTTVNKFSILSRNYRPWRLNLYSKLIEQELLDKFVYSFYNIHPYEQTVFTVTTMIDDLKELTSKPASPEVVDWLFKVPYTLDSTDNVYNKWANVTYQTVAESDFHIAIETHFDHFLSHNNGQYQRGYCPNFITEKTYKAMACNRPFMVFATPHFLDDLKFMGYKTFSEYINEDYDAEENNHKRLELLVDEINRIASLPDDEYKILIKNLESICEYNYQHVLKQSVKKIDSANFKFLEELYQCDIPNIFKRIFK